MKEEKLMMLDASEMSKAKRRKRKGVRKEVTHNI